MAPEKEKEAAKKEKAAAALPRELLDALGPQNAAPKTVRTDFDFSGW